MSRRRSRLGAVTLLSLALAAPAVPVQADPPAHAPAHGWRKKHDPSYDGYQGRGGRHWSRDYGILDGRCNVEAVGAVVGGVIGGAVGSQIGEGDGRRIATVLGSVIGAVLGAEVAREITDVDRACIGHALELGGDSRRIAWDNPRTGLHYAVVPLRSFREGGRDCREFDLIVDGRKARRSACDVGGGDWRTR